MRAFVLLAWLAVGPLSLPAGDSETTAARIPDRAPLGAAKSDAAPLVTEEQVRTWIAKWQQRLNLSEWKIEAKVVRIWDLPQGAVANIHWSLPKRTAVIKVLNSVDSNLKSSEIPRDTELSVVHELVHLSMARLPLDPNHTELEEEAVKRLSSALLDLQESQTSQEKTVKTASTN